MPDAEHATLVEYTRVALCRCGASGNKPYCDGSHERIGFADEAPAPIRRLGRRTGPPAKSRSSPIPNGPLMVEGKIEFRAADGSTFITEKVWLCRCGDSANKPFCDGSHKRIGFTSD